MSGTTEWKELPLGDICTLRAGAAFKPALQGRTTGEIPFIKVSDFNTSRNGIRINNANNWVTAEDAAKIQGKPFPAGTTVFAKIGEALKQNRIRGLTRTTYIDNNLMGAVAKPDVVEPEFLRHLFRTIDIAASDVGTAVPYVKATTLAQRRVLIPPLATQHRIATILSTYDDLIEVNRRRIALLEQMARLLFEEWFVRFRFPGHNSAAPDGTLPQGWKFVPLDKVAAIIRGRGYRSAELSQDEGVLFANLKCFERDGGFRASGLKRYTGPYKVAQVVRRGDIVLAVTDMTQERRIVGHVARIPLLDEPEAVISMDLVKLEPAAEINSVFLYAWLRFSDFAKTAAQYANGANVLHLSPAAIAPLPVLSPPMDLQHKFGAIAGRLLELAETLAHQERPLVGARDLLLPRLISGQLSLPTAENHLAHVAAATELVAAE